MMLELLLQCVMHSVWGGEADGLPALASTSYTEASLPPLPKYSTGLRTLLVGMMAADRTKRLTPRRPRLAVRLLCGGDHALLVASAVTLGRGHDAGCAYHWHRCCCVTARK